MNKYPWLEEYLLSKPGGVRDFKEEWQWDRYRVREKMYAAICTPDVKYEPHQGRTMVLLKAAPADCLMLRETYPDIVPGFYSDKRTWNTIYLDGAVPDQVLRELCDQSYRLVMAGLPKRVQRELTEEEM